MEKDAADRCGDAERPPEIPTLCAGNSPVPNAQYPMSYFTPQRCDPRRGPRPAPRGTNLLNPYQSLYFSQNLGERGGRRVHTILFAAVVFVVGKRGNVRVML